jgi:hypothetical protein
MSPPAMPRVRPQPLDTPPAHTVRRHLVLRRPAGTGPTAAYAGGKRISPSVTSRATATAAEVAILRAILYASIFDFPLSLEELRRALSCPIALDDLRRIMARSRFLQSRVEQRNGWCVPAGRTDLIDRRLAREAQSRRFLATNRRLLDVACALPFTRLIAISGSLAHLNADADADLDLFVITRGPHVWTVTLLLVLAAKLLRRRNVVCANFVLADSHLALEQHDLYTASQVLHLRPVTGAEGYAAFVDANPFVRRWYPNADAQPAPEFPLPAAGWLRRMKRPLEALLSWPSGLIERFCRRAYGWHLRRVGARWQSPDQVRLDPCCLKLHTNSHRAAVLDRFERLVADATSSTTDHTRHGDHAGSQEARRRGVTAS